MKMTEKLIVLFQKFKHSFERFTIELYHICISAQSVQIWYDTINDMLIVAIVANIILGKISLRFWKETYRKYQGIYCKKAENIGKHEFRKTWEYWQA